MLLWLILNSLEGNHRGHIVQLIENSQRANNFLSPGLIRQIESFFQDPRFVSSFCTTIIGKIPCQVSYVIASNELSEVNRSPKLCYTPKAIGPKARAIAVITGRNGTTGVLCIMECMRGLFAVGHFAVRKKMFVSVRLG